MDVTVNPEHAEYMPVVNALLQAAQAERESSTAEEVAEVIFEAATDGTDRLRYVAGADAEQVIAMRAQADDATFLAGMRQRFGL